MDFDKPKVYCDTFISDGLVGPKIRSCKFFDKSQVWEEASIFYLGEVFVGEKVFKSHKKWLEDEASIFILGKVIVGEKSIFKCHKKRLEEEASISSGKRSI